jgi:cation diffusion facilitator CzcD-associated flavoprotein CzcO
MASSGGSLHELDVLIIGAGFGGCYLLHLLRKNGYKTKVVDAATTLGGVWAWNRYPGARVDCEFPYYGFSDPAVWSTFTWTERFPSDSELRQYFEHAADVWDLKRDMEFETTVKSCEYQEGVDGSDSHWIVKTSTGKGYKCKSLVAATGTSFKQHIPEWKGREDFEGVLHHSSLWPQENVELAGKRVAVIGAGSTGVQVVQETSKVAASVTQFIRSPNLALPMGQRKITEDEIYANKAQFPHVFKALKHTSAGLPMEGLNSNTCDVDEKERLAKWDEEWKRGGFNW